MSLSLSSLRLDSDDTEEHVDDQEVGRRRPLNAAAIERLDCSQTSPAVCALEAAGSQVDRACVNAGHV